MQGKAAAVEYIDVSESPLGLAKVELFPPGTVVHDVEGVLRVVLPGDERVSHYFAKGVWRQAWYVEPEPGLKVAE